MTSRPGRPSDRNALCGPRTAARRLRNVLLVLALGASSAQASIGRIEPRLSRAPIPAEVSEIADGQRDVTVSWTLSAETSGSRVVLYTGLTLGLGTPLVEVGVVPGVSSYRFVDRARHHGRWLYWLVVVDGMHRGTVLGTLVCATSGMKQTGAPTGGLTADPALVPVLYAEPGLDRQSLPEAAVATRDLFLESPPSPPPEGRYEA